MNMKREQLFKRLLSLMLVLSMLTAFVIPASAADTGKVTFEKVDNSAVSAPLTNEKVAETESDEPGYADKDMVRVSIVLDKESTIAAGFSVEGIVDNAEAMNYRESLKNQQKLVTASIEKATGEELDVAWNLTLAANIISANVAYGQIEEIEKVAGVKEVLIETQYSPDVVTTGETADPNMATSSAQIGSSAAWAAGYTGAGSRIAVIDTGIDPDHQSFSAAGFNYSLAHQAGLAGKSVEEYTAKLDLLDAAKVAEVAEQLNVKIDAEKTYLTTKIPFAYNYVDDNYTIDHDHDEQGEHGSHVEGIAAANAYIPNEDGSFSSALDSVKVQGVAPDAQIITMKVFGASGGAYDSDYMAAIEDAVILGADSINLSLGSGNPGMSRNSTAEYQAILDSLTQAGAVVCMSAGNSGSWVENANNGIAAIAGAGNGYLYSDDVSMQTNGSPGSFTNSLAVASVDNDGSTGEYVKVNGEIIVVNQTEYSNKPISTLAGNQHYIFIDGFGTAEDWAAIGEALEGKIAVCSRGGISFYQKGEFAAEAGAVGTIIYNNAPGIINMDLTDYTKTEPCVSITQAQGELLKAAAEPVTDADGNILYYEGRVIVGEGVGAAQNNSEYYTMSSFSSWGVPGSLEMKPEITAPGGSIYSVNGIIAGGKSYEVMSGTSMASPQVAGMAAVVAQYIREKELDVKTGMSARQLAQSLLMSTAEPMLNGENGSYYPVLQQGSGLANVGNAVTAESYITMNEDATDSYADGKVKVELGDDPLKDGDYTFSFSINNLTNKDQLYSLYADFFTQDLFQYYANEQGDITLYMDTLTAALEAATTFTVNGEELSVSDKLDGRDVNGDGVVNSLDGQAILDYAAGTTKTLSNKKAADVDGDGDVDSYDAYVLLSELKRVALVPANGSIDVTVNVKLSEEEKEFLKEYYTSGAYIEGYVFAEGVSTEEGAEGTTHSIPVLGFFGNWSDASMFDKGSYLDYTYGTENRLPYLGRLDANTFVVNYAGDPGNYYFGGNPLIPDATYMPERNAINENDKIGKVSFVSIRNAAASRLLATNLTTGEPIMEKDLGMVESAFYYTNGSRWENTGWSLNAGFKPTAKENERIKLELTLVPEYYVDAEGNVNWNALGKGTTFATEMTVDNTAPELLDASVSLTNNTLTVVARDNQYIAAVALFNGSGSKALAACGSAQDVDAGATTAYQMNLDGINGNKFLLQVFDYAMNVTTYKIEMQIGEPVDYTGSMFGFTSAAIRGSGNRWVTINPDELFFTNESNCGGMEDYATSDVDVYAAEYVDGYVFYADETTLYAAELEDLSVAQKVGSFTEYTTAIWDMAFNYADNKMYALDDSNTIWTVDLTSGAMTKVCEISITNPKSTGASYKVLRALAIDDEGNFYSVNHGSGSYNFLYRWTLNDVVDGAITDLAPVVNTTSGSMVTSGMYVTSNASMTWDHNTDTLYLAGAYGKKASNDMDNELWVVNPETGKAAHPNTLNARFEAHVVGLFVVPSGSKAFAPTDTASKIELNKTETTVFTGSEFTLTADVYPWLLEDKSVIWTSSDDAVATVKDGKVTALTPGEVTITATTAAKPNLTATCTVTVNAIPEISLNAVVYGADSTPVFAEFTANNPAAYTAAGEAAAFQAGTLYKDKLYMVDDGAMYRVDADTFDIVNVGTIASSWLYSDAAPLTGTFAEEFDAGLKVVGLCYNGTYLEIIDPEAGNLTYWKTGTDYADDPMALIAYAGETEYEGSPAGAYYVITESGELWLFLIYDGGYLARADLGATGLALGNISANSNDKGSMLYDAETGLLVIANYRDGDESASLYVLDPNSLMYAKCGTFGENVWPAVSLYQYERATELTVKVDPTTANIYERETLQLNGKVILGTTNELTWTTSDASVATVDNTGLVTGVGEGTATITATSVDKNAAGETVSATATINVEGLVDLDGTVSAQITTDAGTSWVDIDLTDMSFTTDKANATAFTGGGFGGDALYGSDVDLNGTTLGTFYKVDAATFAETAGSGCSSDYAPLDIAPAPATTFTYTDSEGTAHTNDAFGAPFYIANCQNAYMLLDYVEGSISGFNLMFYYSDLSAIAYAGDLTVGYVKENLLPSWTLNADDDTIVHMYLLLGADGTLYNFFLAPTYKDGSVSYTMVRGVYGSVGMAFADYQKLSMEYVEFSDDQWGLLIADATDGSIYFANLAGAEIETGKVGTVSGATNITGLYNAQATAATAAAKISASVEAQETAVSANAADVVVVETAGNKLAGKAAMDTGLDTASETNNAATGSLNSVTTSGKGIARPDSITEVGAGEKTVTLKVTAKDVNGTDVASTNGVATVEFDTKALELTGVAVNGDYTSVNQDNGSVTFGYVDLQGFAAGATVATLTFAVKDTDTASVTVTHKEVNNTASGYVETVPVSYEHSNTEIRDAKAATCTEDGYTGDTYCVDCGKLLSEGTAIPATGHSYDDGVITTAATCTEEGVKTFTCSACGDTYTEAIPATGHSYDDGVVTTQPTCTEEGVKTYTCSACGETYTEAIPAKGHNMITKVVEATCTEDGYTLHSCADCDVSYKDSITAATGHSWSEWTVAEADTCFHDGVSKRTCAVCGATETKPIPTGTTPCPSAHFTDVDLTSYAHEGIDYVVRNGYMNGTSATTFAPAETLKRGQLVTILYRIAGEPEVTGTVSFTDVAAGEYYEKAIAWASANGITNGYPDGTFRPDVEVSRQEMVTFLYRFAKYQGKDVSKTADLSGYADADKVDTFAKDAMAWAVGTGIVNGVSATSLAPTATALREQIATIIMRYCTKA